ncbi:ComEC family competence protein [Ancylobacter pratisalsi]|uniref:ComEC family competence protein n=1 Tax=Ancylobacter pratisalsi TaxID=1745854 RepID=A0A6P1YT98_9HYPH|nr:ComEC family competence protein [Ancylobacter pratisalsi]
MALAPRFPTLATGGFAAGWSALSRGLRACAVRELEDRRGFLFLPIAFAAGAALYFGAGHEPLVYGGLVPTLVFGALAILARERPFAFHFFVLLAAISAGFALASLQVQRIAHPVLAKPLQAVEVAGFVEAEERRPRGSRITLKVTGLGRKLDAPPQRVRVTLASSEPPPVGAHVRLRANLAPPPGPAYPGGFDFGRAIWFDGIGATGYALGKVQIVPGPEPPPGLAFAAWLERSREAIAARILATLSGGAGGIAVALVTGLRDGVPESIEESMRISGLSHVLSISGLHMALVAMTVFFLARALLALSPALALRYPIKSWAALPALLAATYYLLLSGAEVPTQRSYVMTLLVLLGVIVGRPALTLRTLAIAALCVMALMPWAILDPGAQMSFAATLALVAAYERFGHLLVPSSGGPRARRWSLWPARYIAALALTSLVAGLATAPFAAFHFQRLAPLSLLANLAAMPVVSTIVMPAGLAGSLLMPFGWDGPAWRVMGWGIDRMIAIAAAVSALPGADRGLAAMPIASLVLMSLALAALCLLRTRLALVAPLLAGCAAWITLTAPRPDLYVDSRARTVAVRGPDGNLALMGTRTARLAERFEVGQWLSAEGARGTEASERLTAVAACDSLGCTLPGPNAARVAYSRDRASLFEDCRRADLVVTPYEPPEDCAATVLYVDAYRQHGGLAAQYLDTKEWELIMARPAGAPRPWQPPAPAAADILRRSASVPATDSTINRPSIPRARGAAAVREADPDNASTPDVDPGADGPDDAVNASEN